MTSIRSLSSPLGKVEVSNNSTIRDLGGTVARVNNISGDEQIALGVNTGDYIADSLLQTTLNENIQFGGNDTTTITIPVDGSFSVNFTNLFDARLVGHTLRLNQGRVRFHVDVTNFAGDVIRKVDGNIHMEDIDFANATGPDNDVEMEYKKSALVRYEEQEALTVTFYNVGIEPAIVRGGVVSGNPAPFVPYWRTTYYDITSTHIVPNGYLGKAAEGISKLQAVYISGTDSSLPTSLPEMSLADKDDVTKRPAVSIAAEDATTGEVKVFTRNGYARGLDTSAYNVGDNLYLGNNGDLVTTPPQNYVQYIGTVIISDATKGHIDFAITLNEDDESGFVVDYNDAGTSTTPINLTADTWTDIPNDGAGAFTNTSFLPDEITQLLDTSTGKIDPTDLQLGSSILIRNDFVVSPNINNSTLDFRYTLGTGANSYTLPLSLGRLDRGAGTDYRFSMRSDKIYMGDTNTSNNPIGLQVKCSSNATLVNNGIAITVVNN